MTFDVIFMTKTFYRMSSTNFENFTSIRPRVAEKMNFKNANTYIRHTYVTDCFNPLFTSWAQSNNLTSVHQFGFRPGHSTLDMLLLLTQQWMQALNGSQEMRAVSLNISQAFDTVWHPALLNSLPLASKANCTHGLMTPLLWKSTCCTQQNPFISSPAWLNV